MEEEDEEDDSDTNFGDNGTTEPPEKPTVCEKIKGLCACFRCLQKEVEKRENDKAENDKPAVGLIEKQATGLTLEVDVEKGTVTTASEYSLIAEETLSDKLLDIWLWFRSHLKSFIYCVWFENGIMLCIVINTMCLAIDSPKLGEEIKAVLSKINDVS